MKRALISVSDKTGLGDFARGLEELGYEIISTGGTKRALEEAGLNVIGISDVTGFPEIMDGRVKTLHPNVHGALLCVRDNPEHVKQIRDLGIQDIDMVVVNLYPFRATVQKPGVSHEEIIENIDIGGPSMLRSASKNYRFIPVICDPADYEQVLQELRDQELSESIAFKKSQDETYALTMEEIGNNIEIIYDFVETRPEDIREQMETLFGIRMEERR